MTVGLSALFAVFIAVFTPADILASHSLAVRLLINGIDLILFLAISYYVFPFAFIYSLRRGWPIFLGQMACYFGVAVVLSVFLTWMDRDTLSLTGIIWNLIAITTLIMIAAAGGLAAFSAFYLPASGVRIDQRDYWRFRPTDQCGLQEHLPFEARGPVQRITTENQYLRVETNRGDAVIRMSLAQAEALLPRNRGIRIHRSHWIASDQIDRIFYENGNARIQTITGASLPVSRDKVVQVKQSLQSA